MQILVAGLGRFGRNLALALAGMGHEVVALDRSERAVQRVASRVTHAVEADATDEDVLREIGAADLDVGVVAMADVEASVLTVTNLRNLKVPQVYAKASSEVHRTILERVGADRVYRPEHDMALRVAQSVGAPGLRQYWELLPRLGVGELEAGPGLVGRTLENLDLRGRFGINVLVIKRAEELIVIPSLTEEVRAGDMLVLVGRDDQLAKATAASESA